MAHYLADVLCILRYEPYIDTQEDTEDDLEDGRLERTQGRKEKQATGRSTTALIPGTTGPDMSGITGRLPHDIQKCSL